MHNASKQAYQSHSSAIQISLHTLKLVCSIDSDVLTNTLIYQEWVFYLKFFGKDILIFQYTDFTPPDY